MSQNTKHYDPTSTPHTDRQLIIVMPDEVVEKHRKDSNTDSKTSFSWKKIAKSAVQIIPVHPILVGINAALTAYEIWDKLRANNIKAFQIKKSETHHFNFPPAHPRHNTLYVGHPSDPNIYYTVASFHRVVFEHKFSEAIELLMNLGATEIRVEHMHGWSSDFAATLGVPIQNSSSKASAGSSSKSNTSLLFEASLPENKSLTLPENLIWYSHEPTWQSVAKGRLSFGLKEFSLTVNYEDDFGINSDLKLKAIKSGLDLGGKFEEHVATSWRLVGKFSSAS